MKQVFCVHCGHLLEEQAQVCACCGTPTLSAEAKTEPQLPSQPPQYQPPYPYPPQPPYAQYPYPPQPPYGQQPPYSYPPTPVKKPPVPGRGFGIAALVLGILAAVNAWGTLTTVADIFLYSYMDFQAVIMLFDSVFMMVPTILSMIFGIVAAKKGYNNNISKAGKILGIVSGAVLWLCVAVCLFVIVV